MINAGWRLPVCIAASFVLTVPSYAELTIAPDETLEFSDPTGSGYDNFDLIDNQGVLNNSNEINNYYSSIINNSGVINNSMHGSFYFKVGADYANTVFNNTNVLNNSGAFISGDRSYISGLYTRLENSGTIVNTGSVAGFYTTNSSGVIDNYGLIESGSYSTSTFNITSTGTLNNIYSMVPPPIPDGLPPANSTVRIHGTLNNAGIINNESNGTIEVYGSFSEGRLVNNGIINNGIIKYDDESSLLSANQIVNSGEINNVGEINAGSLTNTGTIMNEGAISATSFVVDGGVLAGSGNVIMYPGYPGDTEALVITENGTLAPINTTSAYAYGEFAGQMNIDGDVQLDGTFEVDLFHGVTVVIKIMTA